jgi:hypothetical protein
LPHHPLGRPGGPAPHLPFHFGPLSKKKRADLLCLQIGPLK